MRKPFKHLNLEKRLLLERLLHHHYNKKEISKILDVNLSTIYRELTRGKYSRLESSLKRRIDYSPVIAQEKYCQNQTNKGKEIKLKNDHKLSKYITDCITKLKCSPAVVVNNIQRFNLQFSINISSRTIYNYVYKGVLAIEKSDLIYDRKKKRQKITHFRKWRKPKECTIEQRPQSILSREEFGNWEMDSVIGKSKDNQSLLVLTERKTRYEMIFKVKRGSKAVVRVLNRLEKAFTSQFKNIFKTITVDNGSEFSDYKGMTTSCVSKRKKRVDIYYCHPYTSCERGSNENQNRYIRRWFKKGESLNDISKIKVKMVEEWMNDYPRKLFNFRTPKELFEEEIQQIS
ncbi:IS30 family transposase [Bulleidia sp. zg-1006]|uniref:IS30 family transposase n=1 Tax=Bulleidia sp. zg-1006 TaxID=2806552 RepID=UPI0019398F40|nr:IS30 family transposase [Bulleidia sp. zg-1006]QRG86046.1 IS30 family transposase [Bulleidia sp. zg-1006]